MLRSRVTGTVFSSVVMLGGFACETEEQKEQDEQGEVAHFTPGTTPADNGTCPPPRPPNQAVEGRWDELLSNSQITMIHAAILGTKQVPYIAYNPVPDNTFDFDNRNFSESRLLDFNTSPPTIRVPTGTFPTPLGGT